MAVELQRVVVNFGNVKINSSSTLTLNYNVAATTTVGAIEVITHGRPSRDFAISSDSSCTGHGEGIRAKLVHGERQLCPAGARGVQGHGQAHRLLGQPVGPNFS